MRSPTAACSLFFVLLASTSGLDARARPTTHPSTNVRGATLRVNEMLAGAIKRSPTLAALVAALDNTDVIVHVEEVRTLPPGTDGGLLFTVAAGNVRYLRAQVLAGLPPMDRISIIAHELQHALEVAAHREVRDHASFIALYERIGVRSHRNHFDTAAARTAGRKVRSEMTE